MTDFEFLIRRRPLSRQAKRPNLQAWRTFVRQEAAKGWDGRGLEAGDLRLTLVYLCGPSPPDTDNIVKPILDALVGLVFADDAQVADVECHRRALTGTFDLTRLPPLLLDGITTGIGPAQPGIGGQPRRIVLARARTASEVGYAGHRSPTAPNRHPRVRRLPRPAREHR